MYPLRWFLAGALAILSQSATAAFLNAGEVVPVGEINPDVAAFNFEEASGNLVLDVSGNGHHGTLQAPAVRTAAGRFGMAVELNGVSGNVNLGGLDVAGSALTISAWFKADDFDVQDARIISKANGLENKHHYWMVSTKLENGIQRLRFRLKTTSGGTSTLIASGASLARGVWTHVAATYNGTRMVLYQDGVSVGSKAKTGALVTAASVPAWIGANPVGGRTFDGVIDNVRVYRRALTAAEVLWDMNTPVGQTPSQGPPAAPTTLTASVSSSSRIDLQWVDNSNNEDFFEIQRSTAGLGGPYALLATIPAGATTYSDSNLAQSTEYCYRVRATNTSGVSAFSNKACATTSATPGVPQPHNVIVILADDVGVDMVGAYERFYANHPNPSFPNTTPSVDYLADTGMLFRNAWTNPVCSPTRAQILTGRHALHSGIGKIVRKNLPVGDGAGLQHTLDTVPSMLRSTQATFPYYTAAVGKWHLAGPGQHPPSTGRLHPLGAPTKPWFHQYAGAMYNLNTEGYNSWTKAFGTKIIPGEDECTPPIGSFCSTMVTDYATVDTADDAIHLIKTMPEPFFLYVPFNAAHTPLQAPAAPLTPALCAGVDLEGDATCTFASGAAKRTRCMVQWLDNEIGRIICAVENSSEKPTMPTTIIFLGDNGTDSAATVSPFDPTHAKGVLYEGGIHVPFIVKSPLIPAALVGSVSTALVCSTDIFATVAELASAPLPPDPYGLRESVSFVRYLTSQTTSIRRHVYAEQFQFNFVPTVQGNPPAGYALDKHHRAIRNVAGLKLIQTVRRTTGGNIVFDQELYNLANDPHEQNNLITFIGSPVYATAYGDLRQQLDVIYPHLVTP